jgi:hypothetical protein
MGSTRKGPAKRHPRSHADQQAGKDVTRDSTHPPGHYRPGQRVAPSKRNSKSPIATAGTDP